MTDKSWIYVTCSSPEEAEKIGAALVEARLAACANLLPGITSIYWWEGKVQRDVETALVLKSRTALVPKLIEEVKKLHSYDCPCVVALPIQDGNPDFLEWIAKETQGVSP